MVDILLSTYNGSRFLPEQLDSVAHQTNSSWRLVVRDDGSADESIDQLEQFKQRFPKKVSIIKDRYPRLGPAASFSALACNSKSQYLMFCDQDDIWLPDKISKTLETMQLAEQKHGVECPLLVHTDMHVVNEIKHHIASSFWEYQKLSPQLGSELHRLLTQNVVTGCTVMINRPLADRALPIPPAALMHDWWLALVAALVGHVVYINEATVLYRQHYTNSVGAHKWGIKRIARRIKQHQDVRMSILGTISQAQALLERYRSSMSVAQFCTVNAFARLHLMSPAERIRTVLKYNFFKHGALRSVGFIAHLAVLGRNSDKL